MQRIGRKMERMLRLKKRALLSVTEQLKGEETPRGIAEGLRFCHAITEPVMPPPRPRRRRKSRAKRSAPVVRLVH